MQASPPVSEYNRDQRITFQAIREACAKLSPPEMEELQERMRPYLAFRHEVENYQSRYLESICRQSCYETGLSACCGFESIITFFADHVITLLVSREQEMEEIFHILDQPNRTGKCVYLGKGGCLWKVRPISCAMFFCKRLKADFIEKNPEAEPLWKELQSREKEYTWPDKPVLFDDLEKYFMRFEVKSPHMHFHQSPGLVRLKAESGLTT